MSDYTTLKAAIDANINTNGNQEITGAVLNSVLNQMVDDIQDQTDAQFTELESEIGRYFVSDNVVGGREIRINIYGEFSENQEIELLWEGSAETTSVGIFSDGQTGRIATLTKGVRQRVLLTSAATNIYLYGFFPVGGSIEFTILTGVMLSPTILSELSSSVNDLYDDINDLHGDIQDVDTKTIQISSSVQKLKDDVAALEVLAYAKKEVSVGASGYLLTVSNLSIPASSEIMIKVNYEDVLQYITLTITDGDEQNSIRGSIRKEGYGFFYYKVESEVSQIRLYQSSPIAKDGFLEMYVIDKNSPFITDLLNAEYLESSYRFIKNDADAFGIMASAFTNCEYTINEGEAVVYEISGRVCVSNTLNDTLEENDKYYIAIEMSSTSTNDALRVVNGDGSIAENNMYLFSDGTGEYQLLSSVMKVPPLGEENKVTIVWLNVSNNDYGQRTVLLKNPVIINLSKTFGYGKEPSSEEMDHMLKEIGWFTGEMKVDNRQDLWVEGNLLKSVSVALNMNGESNGVQPTMGMTQFVTTYNLMLDNFCSFNNCGIGSFVPLNTNMNWEEVTDVINRNFRKNVVDKDLSLEVYCNLVNRAFEHRIIRFADAKLTQGVRDFSLTTNREVQEPSAVLSEDGNTLYLYGHLKRVKTQDGLTWSEPESMVLNGGVSYIMHNNTALIDGVYYTIGTEKSVEGNLHLFTSTDGLNFDYKGIIFKVGHNFNPNQTNSVMCWGNTALMKEPGTGKFYLFYEFAEDTGSWQIAVATCTDILAANANGTIGNWVDADNNPILKTFQEGGYKCGAGNPDFPKSINGIVRYEGKYYMYYHSNSMNGLSNIRRAYSYDLLHWEDEGLLIDNRDIPTNGENTHGNADHCIVEFKGRSYLFYSWNINNYPLPVIVKYTIDDRPLVKMLEIQP